MNKKQLLCYILCILLCFSSLSGIHLVAMAETVENTETEGEDNSETTEPEDGEDTETGDGEEDMITITAYEGLDFTPTKTIRIKRGTALKLWIPDPEEALKFWVPDPEEENWEKWEFDSWTTDPDGKDIITEEEPVFYEDTSIYAQWKYIASLLPKPEPDTHPDSHSDSDPSLPRPKPFDGKQKECEKVEKTKVNLWSAKNVEKNKVKLTIVMGYSVKTYQIKYAQNKGFKKAKTKTIKVKKDKAQHVLTLKNLTPGKTYYVKVRGIKNYKGKTYKSKWSRVRKVKIRK